MTSIQQQKKDMAIFKARALRFKKPAVADLNLWSITEQLDEMTENLDNFQYLDEEMKRKAFDENDDEIIGFELACQEVEEEIERFRNEMQDLEYEIDEDDLNDILTTVTQKVRTRRVEGYDTFQEDYFDLGYTETIEASGEAKDRLHKKFTKYRLIDLFTLVMAFVIDWYDIREKYGQLQAELDILTEEVKAEQDIMQRISDLYEKAVDQFAAIGIEGKDCREFDRLVKELPARAWVE